MWVGPRRAALDKAAAASLHARSNTSQTVSVGETWAWHAAHEEPADDDAEPRAGACEARAKQPAAGDSGASIATTDSGAGADGANGGAANRATADATGDAAAGTADSEGSC